MLRSEPTFARDFEDDAVGIFEFVLEVFLFLIFAEIEEELAAGSLNLLLGCSEIVDLETEVIRAHKNP